MCAIHIFTFLVLWAVLDAAVVTEYWNDHTVVPPFTDFIIVPSQLACIHRCKNWKHCNIVAISSTNSSDSGLSCLMSWMECYEGYHSRLTRAHGWDVYAFRNKGNVFLIPYLCTVTWSADNAPESNSSQGFSLFSDCMPIIDFFNRPLRVYSIAPNAKMQMKFKSKFHFERSCIALDL